MKVMVFDTETGGLNPEEHSVFSVGALVGDLDTGEIIEQFEAFHKLPSISDYVYTDKAIEIHGITPSQAFNQGIETAEMQDKFTDLYYNNGCTTLGGHNANPFDRDMMAYGIYGITPKEFEANFTYHYVDTLPLIRVCTGNDQIQSGATLTQAVKWFKINMDDYGKNKFHAALFDSVCAFRLMCKFRSVITQPDVVERLRA